MAPRKLLLPFLLLSLIVLATTSISEARRGREARESCKYVGACNTQAQCSSMCNGAGYNPHAVYCDAHRAGGPQCCCMQAKH